MRIATGLAIAFACSTALAIEPAQRTLSFEERVKAQTSIERVYYSHQLGATKTFDEAVPKAVLEAKVHKYLDQTAALNSFWKTAVTDYSLQRELERMAQGTKMPERLLELYAALGNDPFLIKECLARPALVDRLTHNFYAFDSAMHVKARGQAEALHRMLVSGELSPSADHPNRTVGELVVGEAGAVPTPTEQLSQRRLPADAFQKQRAELPKLPGQVSELSESREAFAFSVILNETTSSVRVASYVVEKTPFDAWWETVRRTVSGDRVMAVATNRDALPIPSGGSSIDVPIDALATRSLPYPVTDAWDNGILGTIAPRSDHTSVWTGSLMVVWGGFVSGRESNSGARYDPATDSWSATSAIGAPSARTFHTAVWTGSLMVIWGEDDTGGRYDPVSDHWTATSTVNAPAARYSHGAVWSGRFMVVWGGYDLDVSIPLNTGGRYDPATDSWSTTTTVGAPSGRNFLAPVWTGSLMLVWGGSTADTYLNTGGRYDPQSDTWTPMSATGAPTGRSLNTAVWTGNTMLIWGGYDGNAPVNTGGRYDPVTDHWIQMSTTGAPSVRYGHSAVWTGSLMIVWGGYSTANPSLGDGGRYDPTTDSWTPTSTMGAPAGRKFHSAVWTGSLMVVWGGASYVELGTGGRYDPVTDSWTPTATSGAPTARFAHTAVWTGNVMIVWGGLVLTPQSFFDTGGQYNPTIDSWTPTTTAGAPSARVNHTATWTGDRMVVWGGSDINFFAFDTGGSYDPVNDQWTPTSATGAPVARYSHTAVWTGSQIVVWGGSNASGELDSGGRYNPATGGWAPTATAGAPTRRYYHTAVWTGSLMLVWGGEGYGPIGAGGRYNPSSDSWSPMSVAGSPPQRELHSAVWAERQMIVWGGWDSYAGMKLDTGARYDPSTDGWAPTATTDAPTARGSHTAVWTGRLMVVWGGEYDSSGGLYDPEIDEWTASTTEGAPGPRGYHTALWTGNMMLVWGGIDGSNEQDTGGRYILQQVEICNGVDDDGDGVVDNGGDALCDDGNLCTNDSCQGLAGCLYVDNTASCDDGNACSTNDTCGNGTCIGGLQIVCNDENLCTDDSCDPQSGCVHVSAPYGTTCDDQNVCDGVESCDGYGSCVSSYPPQCDDHVICTEDSCDPLVGCVYRPYPATTSCSDGNACNGLEHCDGAGLCASGAAPDCDDHNACTTDTCNPATGCVYANNTNSCNDGNACTTGDTCGGGTCNGGALRVCNDGNACNGVESCNPTSGCIAGSPLTCNDNNPCTTDGCNAATGCVFSNNTNACNDGNACTRTDACSAGACVGGSPVTCAASDQCHSAGVCSPATGACTNPIMPNGTVCDDASLCTTGETCQSGTCTPLHSGLNHPRPRTSGYYRRICDRHGHDHHSYQGDQLTDADAVCVGQLTSTFAGISTVDEICDVIDSDRRPPHGGRHHGGPGDGPNGQDCDKGENELIATALNICRARVCEEQSLDSHCHGNTHTTVSQSFADADAILDDAARDHHTCRNATCELREINNGHALEMNSLLLSMEDNKVRLTWSSPVLDDGSGSPSSYELWRRPLGSDDAFTKIGTTTGLTFLDVTGGTAACEYDITAVIPGE